MILKINENDNWCFIDGITELTKEMTTPQEFSGYVNFERRGERCRVLIPQGAYLLNDCGGTIEKIYAPKNIVDHEIT